MWSWVVHDDGSAAIFIQEAESLEGPVPSSGLVEVKIGGSRCNLASIVCLVK